MTQSDASSFENAIASAAAEMPDAVIGSLLRYLTDMNGKRDFYSLDVVDFLEGYGMGLPEALASIRILEARGLIHVTTRAGVDAGFTEFKLTDRGIREGTPKTGRAMLSLIGSSGGGAMLYALGIFGVGTGVLGLSSLWESLSDRPWSESIQALVNLWNTVVHRPLNFAVSSPLQMLGFKGLPAWLIDYLGLGGLVFASNLRARQVVDLEVQQPARRPPWVARLLGAVFMILIWPYIVFYEVVIMGALALAYIRKPESVDGLTRSVLPRDRVIARWITFVLPFVLFAGLLLVNAAAT